MASRVDISSQLNGDAGSALNLSSLSQKVRAEAKKAPVFVYVAESFDKIQRSVERLERAARQSPRVQHISIDSADILDLIVGGPDGPGRLEVLSGPPSYARVGWIGTEDSGTTVTITTVSGNTFNTSTPHGLSVGHIFHAEGVSSINHLGWFEVATVPTTTSLTVTGTPTGSGNGGTIERVIAGGHFREIYLGGNTWAQAPLYSTPQGQLRIGKNGSVSLRDAFEVEKGFIGVSPTETPKSVSGTANAGGLVRLTVTAHGYESGDTVVAGNAGYAITVIDANTIDLIGSVFGSFTPVASVSRYFAGIWDEQHASGGTGYADAPFRAKADGSIRIGEPDEPHFEVSADGSILIGETNGPRLEVDTNGDLFLTDADIEITGQDAFGDDFELRISPSGIQIENLDQNTLINIGYDAGIDFIDQAATAYGAFIKPGLCEVRRGAFIKGTLGIRQSIVGAETDYGSFLTLAASFFNGASTQTTISLDAITGEVLAPWIRPDNPVEIAFGGTGAATAADARTALDVYSKSEVYTKAEVDALIAGGFASATHTHSVSSTTELGGSPAHNHDYSTETGTPNG